MPTPSQPVTPGRPATTTRGTGPVAPTPWAISALHPLPTGAARITGGLWARRQQVNRDVSIPAGATRLREAGNLDNLALAAAGSRDADAYRGPLFMDSDVYKWLEAAAWEQGRDLSDELAATQREVIAAVAAAQADDGYLDSHVQVVTGTEQRFTHLPWSHELYCAGHLAQAAVAEGRTTGDGDLLDVTRRFADLLVDTFGENALDDVDGHPVIEMALVELYRHTGEQRYLDLARYCVDARGRGLIEAHGQQPTYFSDRVPVREATTVEGHAVRAVYLAAGATDLAVETKDDALLDALARQWDAMVGAKTYVTGGLGSRWDRESFGDPYELPPDRAYAETCAAIGSVQWSWRLLLATGEARYADLVERTLLNAFLPGVSLDGDAFFYVNALQLREDAHPDDSRSPAHGRRPWFTTACCPPNIMRTLAQLDAYLATADDAGVQLHLYAPGTVHAQVAGGDVSLSVTTDYPWDGRVEVRVDEAPAGEVELALRVPAWANGATAHVGDDEQTAVPGTYLRVRRAWTSGDTLVLNLPMEPRVTHPHPRVDAARGCVALERGPLVYCLEATDHPGTVVDDVRLPSAAPEVTTEHRDDLLEGVTVLRTTADDGTPLVAVPYYAWANRELGPMRVWIPVADGVSPQPAGGGDSA